MRRNIWFLMVFILAAGLGGVSLLGRGERPPVGRDDLIRPRLRVVSMTRVSVDSEGREGNARSFNPSISADGRFVAFDSVANNLVAGDNGWRNDIFVHDRQIGQTTRVSVASNGEEANRESGGSSISADGRFVTFDSSASNLVAGNNNGQLQVFVHDRQTGQPTRVSVASNGEVGNSQSGGSSFSADSRFVTFGSMASNLVEGDNNRTNDIFVHDRQTGQTTRVSISSNGEGGNRDSWNPSISADGRFVVFESEATNLVAGDNNNRFNIFVHDRQIGQTTRVSVVFNLDFGIGESHLGSISGDGRFITFNPSCAVRV